MNPSTSVIIPVYNVEKYLRECLDSVLAQTYREWEAVCVNDGSTDGSAAILAEYAAKDDRFKVVERPNGGPSAARNTGLEHVTGECVYFLDSDDYLVPDALERMISVAALFELDILHFDRSVFYEDGAKKDPYEEQNFFKGTYPEAQFETGSEHFLRQFKNKDFQCVVWTRFFRFDFLKENGLRFHEGILHEDEPFSLMADMLAKRTMSIRDKLYRRRVRAGSIMTGLSASCHLAGCLAAWQDISAFLETHDFQPEVRRAILFRLNSLLLSAKNYRSKIEGDLPEDLKVLDGIPLEKMIADAENWLAEQEAADERANRTLTQKLLSPLKCVKENGLLYTLKRIAGGRK